MIKTNSSMITAVGHVQEANTLVIEFKGGQRYGYENVSPELFTALVTADSIGKFFLAEIKNNPRYPYSQI